MNELLSLFTKKILKDNDTKSARYAIGVLVECMRELESGKMDKPLAVDTKKASGIQASPPYFYVHGQRFESYIEGVLCEGKVFIIYPTVFLLQNKFGTPTREDEMPGFKYAWWIDKGTKQDLESAKVESLILYPIEKTV